MKTRIYFLVLLIFVVGIFGGCSKDTGESKKTESTNLRAESSIPESEGSPKSESLSTEPQASPTGDTKTQDSSLKENTQNIINSNENKDMSGNGEYDISLNGKNYKFNISTQDLESADNRNHPIRITMKIVDSKIVYEDLWNDGVSVKVADFDSTDGDIDIYVTHSGTDIASETIIYKFDGEKLFEYDRFSHYFRNFLYDEKGNIYCSCSDEGIEVNKYYNYKSKKTEDIVDKNQKTELTKLFKM